MLCRPVLLIAAAFTIGVYCSDNPLWLFTFVGLPATILGIISCVMAYRGRGGPVGYIKAACIFLLIPVFVVTGVLRCEECKLHGSLEEVLVKSSSCSFSGHVKSISQKSDSCTVTINAENLTIPAFEYDGAVDGLLSVTIKSELCGGICPGDYISGSGKIYPLEDVRNPGQFDEKTYYLSRGIEARVYAKEITEHITPDDLGFFVEFKRVLHGAKTAVIESLVSLFGEREAGVLISVLTGEKGMLDADVKESFTTGGIAHILAVSGLHVSLVASLMFAVLRRLLRRLKAACIITFLCVLCYGFFTGFSVSTVRAVIMTGIMLLARMLGRSYDLISAAATAELMILLVNPMFVYDGGFLMSFTAIAGVGVGSEVITVCRIRNRFVSTLVANAFVNIFLCPLLINTYFYVSPYSFLINLAVIPLMSLLVPFGAVCAIFGIIGMNFAAKMCAGPAYQILRFFEMLCDTESVLPYGTYVTGHRSGVLVLIYTAIVALSVILCMTFRKKRYMLILPACLLILIRMPVDGMEISMFDVGQGDSILVRTQESTMLVDAGSSSVSNVYKYRLMPALMYMGVDSLDYVVMTHPDKDHKNGIEEMLEDDEFEIGELVVSDYVSEEDSAVTLAREKGVSVRHVAAGDFLTTSDSELVARVVSPIYGEYYGDTNSASIVLEMIYGDFCALLTGDSDTAAERLYVNNLSQGSYDLLKIAHHGSAGSTSEQLLERINPHVSIISCAKYNSYGHPSEKTLSRLRATDTVFTGTYEGGMITVTGDEDGSLCLESWIQP